MEATQSNRKFRSCKFGDGFTSFDAFAIAQKKGMNLATAEELADLVSSPEFETLRLKSANDEPLIANNVSYTSNGDILVTNRESNPIIARFNNWMAKIDPRSFPDHPEYIEAISKIRGAQLGGQDVKSSLIRRTMFLNPEAVVQFIKPAIEALTAYSDSRGISVISPWNYDPRAFHSAEDTNAKKGEPYFISRIKDIRRVAGLSLGPSFYLTLEEGENLARNASQNVERARETGVLFVPRDSIKNSERKRQEDDCWSVLRVPLEELAQVPVTRFLLGDNPERFIQYARSLGRENFPIEFQSQDYVVRRSAKGDVPGGLTSQPRFTTSKPYISAAVYELGSGSHGTPVYGVKR